MKPRSRFHGGRLDQGPQSMGTRRRRASNNDWKSGGTTQDNPKGRTNNDEGKSVRHMEDERHEGTKEKEQARRSRYLDEQKYGGRWRLRDER